MTFSKANSTTFGDTGSKPVVDKLVLATVNAPYKRDISAATLSACLADTEFSNWLVHAATFFTDVDVDLVFRFAELHGISKSVLAKAYMAIRAETGERNPELEAELVSLGTAAQ